MAKKVDPSLPVHDGNWYVLLFNLSITDEAFILASGLSIRSIKQEITVFDLANAGSVGFREWAMLEPLASKCRCEIESAKDADMVPGYDTLNRAWLASALIALMGFEQHLPVAASSYSWRVIAGHSDRTSGKFKEVLQEKGVDEAVYGLHRDPPRFMGQLLEYHPKFFTTRSLRNDALNADDALWIKDHFDTFNRLAAESDSFRFALEAAIDWRYQNSIRSAVGRLWAGIEAVFGVSSELVFRISILSASILAPRSEQRYELFEKVKKLYNLRSKVVHGDKLSPEKIEYAMEESYDLLRRLLLETIRRGHMLDQNDFNQALFY